MSQVPRERNYSRLWFLSKLSQIPRRTGTQVLAVSYSTSSTRICIRLSMGVQLAKVQIPPLPLFWWPKKLRTVTPGSRSFNLKYKHGSNVGTRPSLLRGSVVATYRRDTDTERWDKDLKEAFGYSFKTLRDKLTLYMQFTMWAFSP